MCSLLVAIQVLIKLFIELLDPFLESAGASQNFVSCGSRSLITKDDTAVQPLAAQALGSLSSRRQQQLRAHKQLSPRLRIQSQSSRAVMQHKQKGQRQEVIHAVQYSMWDTITAIPLQPGPDSAGQTPGMWDPAPAVYSEILLHQPAVH